MFRKVFESLEKSNVRARLKAGELACPDCGAKPAGMPAEWGTVLGCANCGTKASLSEWAAETSLPLRRASADTPPPGTRIRLTGDGLGGKVWEIPASGKGGFFLFFGTVWLGITALVSGGFLISFLTGGEIEGDGPECLLVLFFGIFWAIGLAFLYAALREKYMRSRVTVSGGELKLTRELFGRAKVKAMPSLSIREIGQKEFYQQNYKPVFGIEIKGDTGKIRFGSTLAEDEKAWLVAALRESVFGKPEEKPKVAEPFAGGGGREIFSLVVPGFGKNSWLAPLAFTAVGVAFVGIGIFFIEGESMPSRADEPGAGYYFELVFSLVGNGFRMIWLLISTFFAVIGIGISVHMARDAGKEKRIEGNAAEVSIRSYKRGLIVGDRSFPRSEVTDIRSYQSGSSGSTVMKQVELIVGEKVEKVAGWIDGEKADALAAEVRRALGI